MEKSNVILIKGRNIIVGKRIAFPVNLNLSSWVVLNSNPTIHDKLKKKFSEGKGHLCLYIQTARLLKD